jgi:hypothetical protein
MPSDPIPPLIRPWILGSSIALAVVDWLTLIICPKVLGCGDSPNEISPAVEWPLVYAGSLSVMLLLAYFAPKIDMTLLLGLTHDPERPSRNRELCFCAMVLNALILAGPLWGRCLQSSRCSASLLRIGNGFKTSR